MSLNLSIQKQGRSAVRDFTESQAHVLRQGIVRLLEIKDSDIRILALEQCRHAADKGIHAGGAASATVPLVALYYGGFLDVDIADPTRRGQDMFVLSKGHAVAALASIYADLGYFDRSVLKNSRSYDSILNGHPGPILPGIHIATGPMGQGMGVAQGFAVVGKTSPHFDAYALCGDGELQEGPIWEAVMWAGQKHLDNLCVLVDQNNGQLDVFDRMVFPTPRLDEVFRAFDWQVESVDATQYDGVYAALEQFKTMPRMGKPTAIICHSTKGHGSFSDFMNRHKVTVTDELSEQELALQSARRQARVDDFARFYGSLERHPDGDRIQKALVEVAREMHIRVVPDSAGELAVTQMVGPVLTERVPKRDKQIRYDPALLPKIDRKKEYAASDIVTAAMKVFARDPRVASIDADLASTSGLEAGIAFVDQTRALNAGVAESNMMGLGEAFAVLGFNTWISTFCPFWDWKVLRRIAVGYQERLESMASPDSWLSEGHGLDLTLLSTAANFETRTNGATHMGNDDATIFDGMAHLKIIDVSCPQQMLGIMKWVMAGNRGLVYVRVMRAASSVIYRDDYVFEFGKGHILREQPDDAAVIVSSGRGVHEALAAVEQCTARGIKVGIVDMPSVDEDLLLRLHDSGKLLVFAEQNNGYLWQNYLKILARHRAEGTRLDRIVTVNTLTTEGKPHFIHSATYDQLLKAYNLAPAQLAQVIASRVTAPPK
jgi:transketolase